MRTPLNCVAQFGYHVVQKMSCFTSALDSHDYCDSSGLLFVLEVVVLEVVKFYNKYKPINRVRIPHNV